MQTKLVENVLKKLNDKFGQESPLTTCLGKVLGYLGIKIDYRQKGKVKFSMYEYIEKRLEELPTNMEGLAKLRPVFDPRVACFERLGHIQQTRVLRNRGRNGGSRIGRGITGISIQVFTFNSQRGHDDKRVLGRQHEVQIPDVLVLL